MRMRRSFTGVAMGLIVGLMAPNALAIQERPDMARFNEVSRAAFTASDELEAYRIVSSAYEDPDLQPLRELLVQLLANQSAVVGRYREAEALGMSRAYNVQTPLPSNMTAMPAAPAIVEAAKSHRVVMLNEAHTIARTRLLTFELLAPLRKAGFTHLALETLSNTDPVADRGYPVVNTGYYTTEPVFGEIIRQALALGYVLVPYEYNGDEPGQQARETGQAANLAALLRGQPSARVLVHAGHGHIDKDSLRTAGDAKSMAAELTRLTGIDPLSIEQTMMWDHPTAARQHPYYPQALTLWRAQHNGQNPTTPFLLRKPDGQLWSLHPTSNDISVFMAPWTDDQTWRGLGGLRNPIKLRGNPCTQYPCLVEARYQHESVDAIPADRQMLDAPTPITLWLRDGCYRIKALPNHTKAKGGTTPVCFRTSSNPEAGTTSVQWKP